MCIPIINAAPNIAPNVRLASENKISVRIGKPHEIRTRSQGNQTYQFPALGHLPYSLTASGIEPYAVSLEEDQPAISVPGLDPGHRRAGRKSFEVPETRKIMPYTCQVHTSHLQSILFVSQYNHPD